MIKTPFMQADEIMDAFNASADRQYWRAHLAGTRTKPMVSFVSRSSMVCFLYNVLTYKWTVSFNKTHCAFGDFMASTQRSFGQLLRGLKAGGLHFHAPLDDTARLRAEYDPDLKETFVHMAMDGDDWTDTMEIVFKVPEQVE